MQQDEHPGKHEPAFGLSVLSSCRNMAACGGGGAAPSADCQVMKHQHEYQITFLLIDH